MILEIRRTFIYIGLSSLDLKTPKILFIEVFGFQRKSKVLSRSREKLDGKKSCKKSSQVSHSPMVYKSSLEMPCLLHSFPLPTFFISSKIQKMDHSKTCYKETEHHVGVFCSADDKVSDYYKEEARALGKAISGEGVKWPPRVGSRIIA